MLTKSDIIQVAESFNEDAIPMQALIERLLVIHSVRDHLERELGGLQEDADFGDIVDEDDALFEDIWRVTAMDDEWVEDEPAAKNTAKEDEDEEFAPHHGHDIDARWHC